MKIMTAMYTMKKGGSYNRFIMMMEAFLERGWHVHCLSLTPIPIQYPFYKNHVVALPTAIRNGFVTKAVIVLLFPFYLLMMGWRQKIDLIVAFGPLYAFLQSLPRWVLRKPMVTLIRSDLSSGTGARPPYTGSRVLHRIIDTVGILSSDRIIANNLATQKEIIAVVRGRGKEEVKLLFNSIPSIPPASEEASLQVRARLGIPKEGKLVVTAGVLTRGKNFEVLLKCLPPIGMTNLFLAIIGDGSAKADVRYIDELRKLTRALDLEKRIIFTGWVATEELWKIFGAADLFVLPSLKEGMPNVLLEALGADLPSIGSNIPGIRDILSYEELMFDPLDVEVISHIVLQFFTDVQIQARIRRLCQERKQVFLFDWKEKVFERVSGLLFPPGGDGREQRFNR